VFCVCVSVCVLSMSPPQPKPLSQSPLYPSSGSSFLIS
jgi:hypothetical protein